MSTLATSLASAVAQELFARTGRHEEERMGQMIATMTADPGLKGFQRELAATLDRVIAAHLDAQPMTLEAPVKRANRPESCGGWGDGRCATHNRPMGADLLCDIGRGGPLVLPKPTAQKRKQTKTPPRSPRAKKLPKGSPGRR